MNTKGDNRLGGFLLLNQLKGGEGNQGRVYRARCVEECVPGVAVGDIVAIKSMSAKDDAAFEKLKKRTEQLTAINHCNVVKYFGCFTAIGPFSSDNVVVMELLEGESLKERLMRNPGGLDVDEALKIVLDALSGLAAAEEAEIVHRDIKPGNIFLCRDGTVKLIDFEIAINAGEAVSTNSRRVGTYDYMAPEFSDSLFTGDATSDVFSMGVVLHEALTGVTPYAAVKEKGEQADFAFLSRWSQRLEGLCAIHIKSKVRKLLMHADAVIRKAVAEDRDERYMNAREFIEGLKTIRYMQLRNGNSIYRLVQLVGKGGFGEVFKARVKGSDKCVAVKHMLKSSYGERFRREARVMRELDDPSFVRFYDYFEIPKTDGYESFLVMDFLPGMPGASLRDAIKKRNGAGLPFEDVVKAFCVYAQGLALMHRKLIYHRDIKPSNLYYPDGKPLNATIMDLGIARDVNGTLTGGQVPGTLDYMPPEVILPGNRGDEGMDIYALGLCLYESVSGKTGYPRLPSGPDAIEAFYARARSGVPPNFEDDFVTSNPALLALLKDMTELDPMRRLRDANEVQSRLKALLTSGDRPISDLHPVQPRKRVSRVPSLTSRVSEARPKVHSGAHASNHQDGSVTQDITSDRSIRDVRASWINGAVVFRTVLLLLVVATIGFTAKLMWRPARVKVEEILASVSSNRVAKIEARLDAQEKVRVQAKIDLAKDEAAAVISKYDSHDASLMTADLAADEWKLKWRSDRDVVDLLEGTLDEFKLAHQRRVKRDFDEEEARKRSAALLEAKSIIDDYADMSKTVSATDIRVQAWTEKWRTLIPPAQIDASEKDFKLGKEKRKEAERKIADAERDRIRRAEELQIAAKDSVRQSKEVIAGYEDEGVAISAVDARFARWQADWGKYRTQRFFTEAEKVIEQAKNERSMLESGREVATECYRWLANISNVSVGEVQNWRNFLKNAELLLVKSKGEGRISEKGAKEVQKRIDSIKKWAVTVIDNKTHNEIEFGGERIHPVSVGTVIFKKGIPSGVAVLCKGYEPLRIREDRIDSNVIIIKQSQFVESKDTVKVHVPELVAGISCLIDGVEVNSGEVEVRVGRRHLLYRNSKSTYGEVPDFLDQEFYFNADKEFAAKIPLPTKSWTLSPEFEAAKKNAALIAEGQSIVDRVKGFLVVEPLATRRERLEKAYSILSDWKTAQSLAVLGSGTERELRTLYEEEKRRIRGVVRNRTDVTLAVKTDVAETVIPPGKESIVTFEKKWTGDAYLVARNYEFIFLPRVASDFDGKIFEVTSARMTPRPMTVTVPPLEDGVLCYVDGHEVKKQAELRPGEYECTYRKTDCESQTMSFVVKIGENLTLPSPVKWKPSSAMARFAEAMQSFNTGALDVAKKLTHEIGTIENQEKRQELEDLRKAIELREKLEKGK